MKKVIFYGVFLLALSVFIIFRLQLGPTESSQSRSFVIGQQTYIADSQAEETEVVHFTEKGRPFVSDGHFSSPLSIPEDETIQHPSSAALSTGEDDANLVIAGKPIHVNRKPGKRDVATILRGGGTSLAAKGIAEASGSEVNRDGSTQAVTSRVPVNPTPQGQEVSTRETPSREDMQVVGSYENLKNLLKNASSSYGYFGGGVVFSVSQVMRAEVLGNMVTDDVQSAGVAPENAQDFSQTNVQVKGVDEADIVKTDGTYIYQVNRERVVITKAYPPENMEIASTLNYEDKGFSPQEIYVDEDHLVVIGSAGRNWDYPILNKGGVGMTPMFMPTCYYPRDMMRAVIYNIRDKSEIKQVRELELNGSYVSSRKVGQSLYLIANKRLCYWSGIEINEPKPSYRDSVCGDGFTEIDYPDIKYFPDFIESGYLIVAGLNLDRQDEAASVSSYLGSGQNIYASAKNLYMAVTVYPNCQTAGNFISAVEVPASAICRTKIYKFGMSEGSLTYESSGKVPGTVLNQFSMDEYGDNFRIATTQGDAWRTGEGASRSNVYVLDSGMDILGKIEGIAPGEKIYSVRFTGDRGYMVTYRNVDPFFVLDLKDPRNPSILGELKIPGYSNYLHPYDENHVIGFGKDTMEIFGTAFYMGMKMAIFDVSDVSKPVEMFSEKIGDRGTDSELLRNHRALLFSKEMNLLSFPVRIMEVKDNDNNADANVLEYGSFSFQGAYVYNIDLVSGFSLKGRITHLSEEDSGNSGNCHWYDGGLDIGRIIYIDDTLYTLSQKTIRANAVAGLQEIGSLEIK